MKLLKYLCCIIDPEEVVISNVPDIIDVNKLIFILGELGVKVNRIDKNLFL